MKSFYCTIPLLMALMACATDPTIERIDSNSTTDLSGAWNDTDSRLVANAMVDDLLSQPWYNRATTITGQFPTIIVGSVNNLSHEHINSDIFVNDIERALINSNRVEVVASRNQRQEIRDERAEQDIHTDEATRKQAGKELGADMILQGSINTIIDANTSSQVRFYQVDLELIEIETAKKLWLGQKKIKKAIGKNKIRS